MKVEDRYLDRAIERGLVLPVPGEDESASLRFRWSGVSYGYNVVYDIYGLFSLDMADADRFTVAGVRKFGNDGVVTELYLSRLGINGNIEDFFYPIASLRLDNRGSSGRFFEHRVIYQPAKTLSYEELTGFFGRSVPREVLNRSYSAGMYLMPPRGDADGWSKAFGDAYGKEHIWKMMALELTEAMRFQGCLSREGSEQIRRKFVESMKEGLALSS